jgi:hypothetical protein
MMKRKKKNDVSEGSSSRNTHAAKNRFFTTPSADKTRTSWQGILVQSKRGVVGGA